ncbi:MAG: hypothetical protein AAFR23_07120 [Pseudomonadota bacterium]
MSETMIYSQKCRAGLLTYMEVCPHFQVNRTRSDGRRARTVWRGERVVFLAEI